MSNDKDTLSDKHAYPTVLSGLPSNSMNINVQTSNMTIPEFPVLWKIHLPNDTNGSEPVHEWSGLSGGPKHQDHLGLPV